MPITMEYKGRSVPQKEYAQLIRVDAEREFNQLRKQQVRREWISHKIGKALGYIIGVFLIPKFWRGSK